MYRIYISVITQVITQFFTVLQSNVSASQKAFIAVILRKVIDSKAWKKLSDSEKSQGNAKCVC